MQEYICNVDLFYKLVSKMSALSTVLSEMSVLMMCVCVCICVCTCVRTCGKAVVLPVLHKIIINKDDTNFYCNLNRYLMQSIIFYKENRYKKP